MSITDGHLQQVQHQQALMSKLDVEEQDHDEYISKCNTKTGAQGEAKEEYGKARWVYIFISVDLILSAIWCSFFFHWASVALLVAAVYLAAMIKVRFKSTEIKAFYLALASISITSGLQIAMCFLIDGSRHVSSTGEVTYDEKALNTAGALRAFAWLSNALGVIFAMRLSIYYLLLIVSWH